MEIVNSDPKIPKALQLAFLTPIIRALYVLTKAKIPDILHDFGSMDSQALAAKTNLNPQAIFRMLRAVQAYDFFQYDVQSKKWSNNQNTVHLKSGPGSVAACYMSAAGECYEGYVRMGESAQMGCQKCSWDLYFQQPFWQWLDKQENRESRMNFNTYMTEHSMKLVPELLQAYNWQQISLGTRVADIGGGKGHLVKEITKINPGIVPIVFDTQKMIEEAEVYWSSSEGNSKASLVAGDFFVSVPEADIYILKNILHDWNDQKAKDILKVIHKTASKVKDCKLLIMQAVFNENERLNPVLSFLDMTMFTIVDSKERDQKEWRIIFESTGFALEKIHKAGELISILEVRVM